MAGKVPPRPQASKAARKVQVRQHERFLKPKDQPASAPRQNFADRFFGQPKRGRG